MQHRLPRREHPAQQHMQPARDNKSPEIPQVKQIRRSNRHIYICSDTLCEARQQRHEAHEERDGSAPVGAEAVVGVDAVRDVHVRDGQDLAVHDPVVGDEDAGDGRQPDGVAGHEVHEGLGGDEDVPGGHGPGAEDGADELAAADVDVLGGGGLVS